ncbi:MAG: ribonuclease P protein component [Desulfobulbaceae bacterium]|jgi:ribonuclease P protein component|nr:ribonuclease P protein component [Desulfobulbaceae bacterium]HKJ13257.1 ribonuclease P protein component [Desulfobulbales bacterium]MDH3541124.1 ribonuclease P protein component [Desulfobulbaceae bacterium]MDH3775562.1 ribonuclease P protein component [Desulfobulbaceae bacterium]MDH3782072.1 ribonuclease P protein component [Desulfobulbaceae bacterium]
MNTLSLPKAYLLRKKSEFNIVYQHGKRVHGENFSLILLPNGIAQNRLGISIHGQLKGAVKRNRIKRIIREFFRINKRFLQEKSSKSCELPYMDIVITVRKGFSFENPADVAGAVSRLLENCRPLFQ